MNMIKHPLHPQILDILILTKCNYWKSRWIWKNILYILKSWTSWYG